jgi:ketosteroid isomerase-like protein
MARALGLIAAAVGLAACARPPGPMPEAERARIAAELAVVSDSFQAAIERADAAAYTAMLAPPVELRFARDGAIVSGLHDEARRQFATVASMQCEWPARTFTVLSRDVGVVTSTYRCTGSSRDGTTWAGSGAWTNVFQRRVDRWVIVEAHESHGAPRESPWP